MHERKEAAGCSYCYLKLSSYPLTFILSCQVLLLSACGEFGISHYTETGEVRDGGST